MRSQKKRARAKKEQVSGDKRLGTLIRTLRETLPKSLRAVATLIRSNRGRLSEIEQGKRMPEAGELIKLRTALELSDDKWMQLSKSYLEALQARLLGPHASHLVIADRTAETVDPKVRKTIKEIAISLGCAEPALLWAFNAARADAAQLVSQRRRIVEEGLEAKVLLQYYSAEKLAHGGLVPYTCTVDGSSVVVPVASRPDWCGLRIPLGGKHEQCALMDAAPLGIPLPDEKVIGRVYAALAQQGVEIWNGMIYRLLKLAANTNHLTAAFAREEYFRHRFTTNVIIDELMQAIIRANFLIDEIPSGHAEFLPLRQRFLPDGRAMVDFEHRVCATGVMTLFAMARSQENDFVIPLKRRSGKVATKQGLVDVIPEGFHQPLREHYGGLDPELKPSFSVLRELYEELFRGREVKRGRKRLRHDWFLDKRYEPMGWFREHGDAYSLECTSCGIELASGDCTLGILFVIRDGQFWDDYSSLLEANYEFLEDVPINSSELNNVAGGAFISSRNRDGLAQVIQRSDWDTGGLFAFIEGLRRLEQLEPSRVNLPRIEL